ncbi:MAG: CDP-alcohol phosphatidyltransferase family protein [Myxococcales bacterium]|nr:CDP-alcohol phosphatidyltransferase family protein [Myxococcales bacterium]
MKLTHPQVPWPTPNPLSAGRPGPTLLLWYPHRVAGTPLLRVLGLTLAKRAVLSAQQAGFERIVIAAHPADHPGIQAELADDRVHAQVELDHHPRPTHELALALGDRVWTRAALTAIAAPLRGDATLRALVDDARRPTGLFRVGARQLARLGLEPDRLGEALSAWPAAALEQVQAGPCVAPVGAGHPLRPAEDLLLQALRKPADGMISRHINRHISLAISRRLAKTAVRPNHITAVVAFIGVLSGPLAWYGGAYWGLALGALCYYLAAILDGCDGEISRLKALGSPLGAWLDTITDNVVCLSFILGAYGRVQADAPGRLWAWVGLVGVGFFLLTLIPRYYVMATRMGSGDYQKLAATQRAVAPSGFGRVVQGAKDVVFRNDFLPFFAFVTALLGHPGVFLLPFAVGAVFAAGDAVWPLLQPRPASTQSRA